jgi:hypothetical protein
MPAMRSGLCLDEIECQWHDLAERRLAYYQELYRSGRWTHYYETPEQFAVRMFDVIRAAKAFRKLAGRPAAPSIGQESAPPRPDDLSTAA